MSACMKPVGMKDLLEWIIEEYCSKRSIFGIPEEKFFFKKKNSSARIFNQTLDLPLGPAAGPHTQMAQNIVSAYICGARFFELKTVQRLDQIKVNKPCIDAEDEAYNVEWSQELSLQDSYAEYVKAWFLIHFLNAALGFSGISQGNFIFNMSVGYDLEGIRSDAMDNFIEDLKDASENPLFEEYRSVVFSSVKGELFDKFERFRKDGGIKEKVFHQIGRISPNISSSATLSTMHGCPPEEIESIAEYLIKEKHLESFVKLNPTLLGYETVSGILNTASETFSLDKNSFAHDLQMDQAIPLINNLRKFAEGFNLTFGIKLSNTLAVNNNKNKLADRQMYMSGRTLFPLTINLAYRLAEEFKGRIPISFSGGASYSNILQILETGIYPVTLVTDLLKPGGYMRLRQMADAIEDASASFENKQISIGKLKLLAEDSLRNPDYSKSQKTVSTPVIHSKLKMFDCYAAPCASACPIHQDIPEYISLIREGDYKKALELIVSKNPLPNITGYICDHKCMSNCIRCEYDAPVQIRELKKAAAEKVFPEDVMNNMRTAAFKSGAAKAAVIGAGPAGLSAAYFLAKAGFDVTVFEMSSSAGGTVRHTIPSFRIPQSAIDRDVELIEKCGVKFVYNFEKYFSIPELKEKGYKYIYVATGASDPAELNLGGKARVYNAIEYLRAFNSGTGLPTGNNIAVIGGGNSAMDSARAALRTKGVKKVHIIYRRTKEFMPADKEEFDAAIKEGVIFKELLLPVEMNGGNLKCQKMELTSAESDGRKGVRSLSNSFEEIECDTVISAIGEHIDYNLFRSNGLIGKENRNPFAEASSNESLLENVFIGGDALRGPSTVVNAIADGKKTAEFIIEKESGSLSTPAEAPVNGSREKVYSSLAIRGYIFREVPNSAPAEAQKCLGCSTLCNICVEVCPNCANVAISTETDNLFNDKYQIVHIDSLCNECGNCATFCPYEGAPHKDKTTLFHDKKSFNESNNNGFFVDNSGSSEITISARFGGEKGIIIPDRNCDVICTSFEESLQDESFDKFIRCIKLVLKNYNFLIPGFAVKKIKSRERL